MRVWSHKFVVMFVVLAPPPGAALAEKSSPFLRTLETHFANWDRDGDGKVSKAEMEAVLGDSNVKGEAAAAAAAVYRTLYNKMLKIDSLSVEEIRKYVPKPKDAAQGMPDFESLFVNSRTRIEKTNRALLESTSISLDALHQGRMGDCFALAPLGALLHRDPEAAARMITQESNGNISFRFPRWKVSVLPPTDGEIAMMGTNANTGLWMQSYEKAVGVFRAQNRKADTSRPLGLLQGGPPKEVMQLLTGNKVRTFSCKVFQDSKGDASKVQKSMTQLHELLAQTSASGRMMTMSTLTEVSVPGMTPRHAYAVLGYNAKTRETTIWNPHGSSFTPKGDASLANGYPRQKGIFRAPLNDLVQFVYQFNFETAEADK